MNAAVRLQIAFAVILTVAAMPASAQEKISPEQLEFFESKIRPVLVANCYECHNSTGTAEGNLAVDHRAAMRKGGDSGSLFNKSDPASSLLLQVVRHEIDGQKMPEGGAKLSPVVIADLKRWVEIGAPDPREKPPSADELEQATSWEAIRSQRQQWWSFQPISDVKPPDPVSPEVQHPVDRFIAARLKQEGLSFSQSADRQTLLRRTTFALTGLPPSKEQADRFLNDQSDKAFENLVDRLLGSPQFGERWARHWMDWIRYAESHGSEGDPRIENAWMYRDYLIRSLNSDVPYDQLVKEHIAGDLLPNPRLNDNLGINESVIATAHWRMVFHGFAPTDALDEKVRFVDDQIDAFSKAFLGLTVSCARCHNHKFDAISQADYYALFGVLGSCRPGRSVIDTPAKQAVGQKQLQDLKPRIREAIARDWLDSLDSLPQRLLTDGELIKRGEKPDSLLHPWFTMKQEVNADTEFSQAWNRLVAKHQAARKSVAEFQKRPATQRWNFKDPDTLSAWFAYGNGLPAQRSAAGEFAISVSGPNMLTGIFPASVVSGGLSSRHAARLTSPDFPLNGEHELWLQVTGDGQAATRYVVQNYPRNGTVYPVKTLNGKPGQWEWQKFDLSYWKGDSAHIELTTARDAPLLVKNNDRSWFGIRSAVLLNKGAPPPQNFVECHDPIFAQAEGEAAPNTLEQLAQRYVAAIRLAVDDWKNDRLSDSQALLLDQCMRVGLVPAAIEALPTTKPLVEAYRKAEQKIPVPTRVPALAEWAGHDQPLFDRGNHKRPMQPVARRFLEAIDATPYQTDLSGRLQLADSVLHSDNPLTRRVIVNRLWHHLFGLGIVATPDNLGRLGAKPTHRKLLDYLAERFDDEGWRLKSMIRLLVTSQTWQQSSLPSELAIEKDPSNALLSHAHLRRLEAEAIRDSLLTASGRIDHKMFGPPVNGSQNRRSVYVAIIRNRLDPFLSAFDAPVPFGAKGRRDVTNVPAQSLLLLNDPFVNSHAKALAESVLNDDSLGFDREKTAAVWERVLSRLPTDSEMRQSEKLLTLLRAQYAAAADDRRRLTTENELKQKQLFAILNPTRQRLEAEVASDASVPDLRPLAVWDFEDNGRDLVGELHSKLHGSASIADGALILDGRGWASSAPLKTSLQEKTLEVTVQLNDLAQRSGGAITVQTTDGILFDSIVYAERRNQRWMAGSNGFARTRDLNAFNETDAQTKPVHIVMTYRQDGTIQCFRNGKPYGRSYKTGFQKYAANRTHVIFGMRHGTSLTPGRMLKGRILDARLYDRVLTPEEVYSAATGGKTYITEKQILAALSEAERDTVRQIRADITNGEEEIRQLGTAPPKNQEWVDLVHSLFNLKEFIYVR